MHIIANEVNINCQTRAAQQSQRSAADENELGPRWDTFSQALQKRLDFGVIQGLCPFVVQALLPDCRRVKISTQPIYPSAAQLFVTFC